VPSPTVTVERRHCSKMQKRYGASAGRPFDTFEAGPHHTSVLSPVDALRLAHRTPAHLAERTCRNWRTTLARAWWRSGRSIALPSLPTPLHRSCSNSCDRGVGVTSGQAS
jgi:hypothetical protein